MADLDDLLTAFRDYLVDAELVRRPSVAGAQSSTGGAPPMHVSPINGPPAAGEAEGIEDDKELVLSLLWSTDVAPATAYDAALSGRHILDVRFRAKTTKARRRGMALAAAITRALINPATNYGYGFDLAGVFVLEVNVAGGGPISNTAATGFDDVVKYLVELPR